MELAQKKACCFRKASLYFGAEGQNFNRLG